MKKFKFFMSLIVMIILSVVTFSSCSNDDFDDYNNTQVNIKYEIYSTKSNYYVVKFTVNTSNISSLDISQIGFNYGTTSSMKESEYINSGKTEWSTKVNIYKKTKYYYQGWIKTKSNNIIKSDIEYKKF